MDIIKLNIHPNNKVNLCDSCTKNFPECEATANDIIFGTGVGNDNICSCAYYIPYSRPFIRCKYCDAKC